MKFQNLSVKRLFGRVAIGLALSMSGITIALFFVTKQSKICCISSKKPAAKNSPTTEHCSANISFRK